MAFINEWVPAEDVEKYNLRERNKLYFKGDGGENWTVDKEREIYLRHMREGRGNECTDDTFFDFYWRGHMIYVNLGHEGGGVYKGPRWVIWTLKEFQLPDELKSKRVEVLEDLKAALTARRDFGILSKSTEYSADFKNFN
jgi:hypothetical protein